MSAEHIYEVVANVNLYSEFVPFCLESILMPCSPEAEKDARAQLTVGFKGVKVTYVSLVNFIPFSAIEVCS